MWSASTGPITAPRSGRTAPTSRCPTSPTCWTDRDTAVGVHGRAVVTPGDRTQPGPAGPDRVGVRVVERAPGVAGQPGRGRAARFAGDLPQRGARAAAAALRRGRIRLS